MKTGQDKAGLTWTEKDMARKEQAEQDWVGSSTKEKAQEKRISQVRVELGQDRKRSNEEIIGMMKQGAVDRQQDGIAGQAAVFWTEEDILLDRKGKA